MLKKQSSLVDSSSHGHGPQLAKEYTLDIPRIPSVELPLKVSSEPSSIQKAIWMCGGLTKLKDVLTENGDIDSEKGVELYLNETERAADGTSTFFNEHPINGKKVPFRDESVILKISLPKGSLQEYGNNVQEALSQLPSKSVRVLPVAIINNTVKFRELSDFQVCLDNTPSAKEFNRIFGTLNWQDLKEYVHSVPDNDSAPFENISNLIVDRKSNISNADYQLPPPPRLSMVSFPLLYKYKGNPFATKKSDGMTEVKGTYIKNYQQFVHDLSDRTVVPIAPHPLLLADYKKAQDTEVYPGTKKESGFYESLTKCLALLETLFSERPIWVKRHIDGIVPKQIHHTLKVALSLKTYRFTMGPWRNTYIKLGIDPRSSAEYAKYQTEYFKIERKLLKSPAVSKNIPQPPPPVFESNVPGGIDSRFRFNGTQVPWYLMLQIDLLTDEPNINEVFQQIQYLDKPNELTGWFKELDLAKIRRIVKYELGCMVQGNFNFSVYKLKYFKTMLYSKESMMMDASKDKDGDVAMVDGDVKDINEQASSLANDNEEDVEEDDNGVECGEVDDATLEADDDDDDDNTGSQQGGDLGTFDYQDATFQELVDRIATVDKTTAEELKKRLNGIVQETKL